MNTKRLLNAITEAHDALLVMNDDDEFRHFILEHFENARAMLQTLHEAQEVLRPLHGVVILIKDSQDKRLANSTE